jgi:hypothetical protein
MKLKIAGRDMKRKLAAITFVALTACVATPACSACRDDNCRAVETILKARGSNFSAFKGRPGRDPHGLEIWDGKQAIAGLIDTCYVYRRGETGNYEYRCDAGALGNKALPRERAQKIADAIKAAVTASDPGIVWFTDPTVLNLADVEGFEGSEAVYGGYSKDKLVVKVEIVGSPAEATAVEFRVFARNYKRRDVK